MFRKLSQPDQAFLAYLLVLIVIVVGLAIAYGNPKELLAAVVPAVMIVVVAATARART